MRAPKNLVGTLLVALAAASWGTWAWFLRGRGLPPAWMSVLILLVIASVTLPIALTGLGRPQARRRSSTAWLLLAALGALDAGNYILYFAALDRGPVSVAVLTHYLAPVVIAALAPMLLHERPGSRTGPALAGSLLGLLLLVAGTGGLSGSGGLTALLGAASAFFYAGNTLLSKKLFVDFSLLEVLGWHVLISALLLLVLAPWPAPPLSAFLWKPIVGALLLGVGGATLFYMGLVRIPASRAAVLTYLEPMVASLVGALAFGERLSGVGLVGMGLILACGIAVALQGDDVATFSA